MSPETKQLILIGDHKQLRPRASYDFSVEKGDGYDLNRSLFERLVLKRYPHDVLAEQHRMRPEISHLVRELTYSELTDAPRTSNRPDLRGFSSNVIFVGHDYPEDGVADVDDLSFLSLSTSKRNTFEAEMTLRCLKYLMQQNYNTENIVILTPYLGQLHLIVKILGGDFEAQLNPKDAIDLAKSRMATEESESVPEKSAKGKEKPKITISTIGECGRLQHKPSILIAYR